MLIEIHWFPVFVVIHIQLHLVLNFVVLQLHLDLSLCGYTCALQSCCLCGYIATFGLSICDYAANGYYYLRFYSHIGYHSLWIYKQLHWLPFFVDIQTATLVTILCGYTNSYFGFHSFFHLHKLVIILRLHSFISFELLLLHIQLHWFPLTISLDS